MSTAESQQFQERMQRVETLVERIEQSASPEVRAAAQEMVRALLDLHAAGLGRMLALLAETGEPGRRVLDGCVEDDLLASLLALHDLHPEDLETRVAQALESVRPYLQSHGGDVELTELTGGTVRIRMQGSCNGCPSSSATLRQTIEQAIYEAAPEVASVEAEGEAEPAPASGFVQLGLPQREDDGPQVEDDRKP